ATAARTLGAGPASADKRSRAGTKRRSRRMERRGYQSPPAGAAGCMLATGSSPPRAHPTSAEVDSSGVSAAKCFSAFARTASCVRGPRGLGRLAGPGRLGPPAGGGPEKEVIHWIVAAWLRWRWRPRRGTRTLWRLMSSLTGTQRHQDRTFSGPVRKDRALIFWLCGEDCGW